MSQTELLTKNSRILVIDDDLDIWKAYGQVLECPETDQESALDQLNLLVGSIPANQPTFTVDYAPQGQEGFERAKQGYNQQKPYAVAFVDIRMPPGWDGLKTAAHLRELDADIEIVIVTAYSDRSRAEIAAKVGSNDKLLFIRKPFDAEELMQLAVSLTDKWQITINERQQRQQVQTILRTSPAAIFTLDGNGDLTSWNPRAEEMTGFSHTEVLGKKLFSWQDETSSPSFQQGPPFIPVQGSQEIELNHRNGSSRVLAMQVDEIAPTEPGKELIGSLWDITHLKTTEQALKTSESRFRSLVETTSDWVWEMDREGRFTYCSPICETLYGYSAAELLGCRFYDILLSPEAHEETRDFIQSCLATGQPCREVEREYQRKDGSTIYIESNGIPIFDDEGKVCGYRGIDRDISSRKKHEEEVRFLEEQQRQSQKMGALGTLAGGIAHDMNNILTPIIGFSELAMMMHSEPESKLYKQLENINLCSHKAADLIRQILAFSRKQEVELVTLSLNEVIDNFHNMLRRLIREDIALDLHLAEPIWPISADRSQMEQVLVNLIVNARDAMDSCGKTMSISTSQAKVSAHSLYDVNNQFLPPGEYTLLQVQDSGIGMDPQTITQIFDPFYTTKDMGQGTGLGLSTVFGIIGQHHGFIRLHSTQGHGSTFQIYLPRSTEEKQPTKSVVQTTSLPKGKETILLVEDNIELQTMLTNLLEELGYQVIKANNGQQGLDIYMKQTQTIDLVISDVIMPIMGGVEMVQQIRRKIQLQPILFITGYAHDKELENLLRSPLCLRLDKPFTLNKIATSIRPLLSKTISPADGGGSDQHPYAAGESPLPREEL